MPLIENDGDLIVSPVEKIPPNEDGFRILGLKVNTENMEILKIFFRLNILSDVIDVIDVAENSSIDLAQETSDISMLKWIILANSKSLEPIWRRA